MEKHAGDGCRRKSPSDADDRLGAWKFGARSGGPGDRPEFIRSQDTIHKTLLLGLHIITAHTSHTYRIVGAWLRKTPTNHLICSSPKAKGVVWSINILLVPFLVVSVARPLSSAATTMAEGGSEK